MGFFDDWLLPIFTTAVEVAAPEAAPALEGAQALDEVAKAAEITSTLEQANNLRTIADTATTLNQANVGNMVPGMAGITSGLQEVAPILNQSVAQGVTTPLTATTSGLDAISGPQMVQDLATTGGTSVDATGIGAIGPNMGQVNPMNYGNAVPGMPTNAPFGSVYTPPSPVTNAVPGAFNTSAGTFEGATPSAGSAMPDWLSKGFGKAMDWAEKNPIAAAYGVSSIVDAMTPLAKPKKQKEDYGVLGKMKLSPDFQGLHPTPNVYASHYAEGGIAAIQPANVDFMGGDMYPQSQQQRSFYATPTQMPTSAQQAMASYEPKTNPLTGQPTMHMAKGGLAAGGVVFWDPDKQQYYTVNSSPMGGLMGGITGKINYLGATLDTADNASTLADNFQGSHVTPNVYQQSFAGMVGAPDANPLSNQPLLASLNNSAQQVLDNSYNLLQSAAPNIAAMTGAPSLSNPAAATPAPEETKMAKGGVASSDVDVGIVSEDDPDFAFTSPYETAAGRLKKLYSKTHYNQKTPAVAPALGTVDFTPANMKEKKAAGGGIMSVPSLGGYAAGGNPRLLKGPGDGMSDNIPAVIGNKQPARLADGEFVIPADVVSHLGNGSTEAGAKKLHGMMDNVRKARTGRKSQGKQINADKYLPK